MDRAAQTSTNGKIVCFEIPAADTGRAPSFYGDLFGWQFQPYEGQDYQMTDEGGGAIFAAPEQKGPMVFFDVEDIDVPDARARARGRGQREAGDPRDRLLRRLQGHRRQADRSLPGRVLTPSGSWTEPTPPSPDGGERPQTSLPNQAARTNQIEGRPAPGDHQCAHEGAAQSDPPQPLLILHTTSKTFTEEGRPIIWEHGRRNIALRAAGTLSIVCPVTDGTDVAGIGIFGARLDDVRAVIEADPALRAGVLAYELHPVRGFPGDSLPG